MKKNIPLKKRQGYHGFLKKYHNVYLFIAILVGCGILMGIIVSNYIDVSDIKSLSSYLTTIDSGVDKYDYFVSQFFSGIVFILFVFLLGTSLIGIPIISFIAFTKGMQIGFSCALFVYTYHLKGIAGIIMTLLPQVAMDLIATFLISASAIQLSMYIIYSNESGAAQFQAAGQQCTERYLYLLCDHSGRQLSEIDTGDRIHKTV